MTAAAFKACYAEWKVIKTRATVQLVFEIPIEQADQAYQALGGMPIAAHEVWCGIARLKKDANDGLEQTERQSSEGNETETAAAPSDVRGVRAEQGRPAIPAVRRLSGVQGSPSLEKERRAFGDMPPPQQAGMLSQDRAFRLFLAEKFDMPLPDPDEAANVIRHHCKVKTRADIKPENAEWSALVLAYRLWQREPEFV